MASPRVTAGVSVILCLASVGLIVVLEVQRRQPVAPVPSPASVPTAAAPPVARVVDAARALKLVTWQFATTVDAQSVSDRWYGDAVADVRAPVRYQYGVDLAEMRREDVLFDAGGEGGGRVVFIVPPPKRIAVEVDLKRLEQTLETSGVRWRSQNGTQIESARKLLADRAEAMQLSAADEKRLRDASRGQLEGLLRNTLGSGAFESKTIEVRFAD